MSNFHMNRKIPVKNKIKMKNALPTNFIRFLFACVIAIISATQIKKKRNETLEINLFLLVFYSINVYTKGSRKNKNENSCHRRK